MGWIKRIHDCPTPNLEQIAEQQAEVGSEWKCEETPPGASEPCGDSWKLRQKSEAPQQVIARNKRLPDWQRLTINGEPVPKHPSGATRGTD